jgi:hypothetical protein
MTYFEDNFSQPAAGSKFRPADYQGHLLLVWPTEYRSGIKTDYGESDAVAARVVVLDGENGHEEHDNVLFFQGALIGTLKPSVGSSKPVLGRLSRGTSKPGQSAPFILTPFTEEDAQSARDYFAKDQFDAPAEKVADTPAPKPAAKAKAKKSSLDDYPADKVDLAKSLGASGVSADQIALATQIPQEIVESDVLELI